MQTAAAKMEAKYFLPYQAEWLADESMFKIWEKTRRGGMTYVQAFEDVRDAVAGKWDVWFSSADDTAAREYILYCEHWTKLFKMVAALQSETVIDENNKAIRVHQLTFKSGKRITALTSSPSQFRSKGGKVVLDEFAFHRDAEGMWSAAEPVTTWGFPLRIISTHNGKSCKFYKLLSDAKSGKLTATVHSTPIQEAIKQGLLDKILKHKTTEAERAAWIAEKKKRVGLTSWTQEYCAEALDDATALFSYSFIEGCMRTGILKEDIASNGRADDKGIGSFVLGMDIGRRRNLTVIWIAEVLARHLYTRKIDVLENTPFRTQYSVLKNYLSMPNCRRACLDMTGIGEQLTEDAIADFGSFRVEGVRFSLPLKITLVESLYTAMEDKEFLLPDDPKLGDIIKEDFHTVQSETTAAGNRRIIAEANEEQPESHADYFWSAALCNHARGTGLLTPLTAAAIRTPAVKPVQAKLESGFFNGAAAKLERLTSGAFGGNQKLKWR